MNRERVAKIIADWTGNQYCHEHYLDIADRIIAEEADDDALGIAYKKGFEDGKAKAEEGKIRHLTKEERADIFQNREEMRYSNRNGY